MVIREPEILDCDTHTAHVSGFIHSWFLLMWFDDNKNRLMLKDLHAEIIFIQQREPEDNLQCDKFLFEQSGSGFEIKRLKLKQRKVCGKEKSCTIQWQCMKNLTFYKFYYASLKLHQSNKYESA